MKSDQITKRILCLMTALSGAAFLSACGSSGSSGSSTAALNSIATLPAATGPVGGASSSSVAAVSESGVSLLAAAAGVKVAGTSLATAFPASTTKSRAMCEIGNVLRETYTRAGQADKILCYVGKMEKAGLFTGNLYDGADHYFELTMNGSIAGRVKLNIAKAASGAITKFTEASCFGSGGPPTSQTEYVSLDISNPAAVSMTAINADAHSYTPPGGTASNQTFNGRTVVAGALSGTTWTSKTITMDGAFSTTGAFTGSGGNHIVVGQSSTGFTINSFNKGTFPAGGFQGGCPAVSMNFTNNFKAFVQGIGMDSLTNLALGDGAGRASFSNSPTASDGVTVPGGCSTFTQTAIGSWLGDTQMSTGSNAFTAQATASALDLSNSDLVSSGGLAFSGSQVWNCSAATSFTSVTIPAAIITDFAATCDKQFGGGGDWVNCQGN
jgi:hypothetical protein